MTLRLFCCLIGQIILLNARGMVLHFGLDNRVGCHPLTNHGSQLPTGDVYVTHPKTSICQVNCRQFFFPSISHSSFSPLIIFRWPFMCKQHASCFGVKLQRCTTAVKLEMFGILPRKRLLLNVSLI